MKQRKQLKVDQTGQLLLNLLLRISTALESRSDARFTYLIGDNGAGKSRMLADVAQCIAVPGVSPTARASCISSSLYDRFSRKYESSRVQYFGSRNPETAVFHSSIDRSLCRMILTTLTRDDRLLGKLEKVLGFEFHVSIPNPPDPTKLVDRRKLRNRSFDKLFLDKEKRALARMRGKLNRFRHLDRDEVTALQKLADYNGHPSLVVKKRSGGWLRFNELSSGEQSQALLFAKILSVAQDGMAILIDEPEISLHLHWQMTFHSSLATLLKGIRRIHVVVATHAPVVISEAARFDPRSLGNVVMVLKKIPAKSTKFEEGSFTPELSYEQHSFSEIASHEQLVLRYFDTAPYRTQAVGPEVAEAVLGVANDRVDRSAAIISLKELHEVEGMSTPAKRSIRAAITMLEGDILSNLIESSGTDEIALY